jgi:hypothetical protein
LGIANIKSDANFGIKVSITGGTVKVSTREQKMEAVCDLLRRHGYEMGRNQIAEQLRSEGNGMNNEELKFVMDSLVSSGHLSHRKDGQKYLYGYQSDFFANDVKAWSPND